MSKKNVFLLLNIASFFILIYFLQIFVPLYAMAEKQKIKLPLSHFPLHSGEMDRVRGAEKGNSYSAKPVQEPNNIEHFVSNFIYTYKIKDANNDGILYPGESANLKIVVINKGNEEAKKVEIQVDDFGGIEVKKTLVTLGNISPSVGKWANFPIFISLKNQNDKYYLKFNIIENSHITQKKLYIEFDVKKTVERNKNNKNEIIKSKKSEISSSKIKEIQKALKKLGYNPGPIDGKMGRKIFNALKNYQKKSGLQPTGKLSKKNIALLLKSADEISYTYKREKIIKNSPRSTNKAGLTPPESIIAEQQKIKIKVSKLNVRKGPGSSHPVIATIKANKKYSILEKKNRWIKIQLNSNKIGWVYSKYVEYLKIKPATNVKKESTVTNSNSNYKKIYWILPALVIVALFLLPSKSNKQEADKKSPKPKLGSKFKFPEIVDLYINNSFQILGLIPHKVNARSIHKRKNELAALIKADLPPKEHLKDYHSISWPDVSQATESGLTNAYARLQDTIKSVEEELFWFHLEEDKMEPFEYLLKGEFKKGQELWETEIKDNPKNYAGGNAKHNLAVLIHACTLNQEKNISSNPGMNSSQINSWKKVFILWRDVYMHDKCWQYFMQRIVYLDDPRINKGYVRNNLRRKLPLLVLKPNLEIACSAVAQDMLKYAKQHLDLIRNSGFDSKDINHIERDFFAIFLRELKTVIHDFEKFSSSNHKEIDERYKEYRLFLEKSAEIKKRVDYFDGYTHIKREIEEIVTLAGEPIKKDLMSAIDKVIGIENDITKQANLLITLWNSQSSYSFEFTSIRNLFEENAGKIKGLKRAVKEGTDITNKGKRLFETMKKLCSDNENKEYINKDIAWMDKQKTEFGKFISSIEDYINKNLTAMRG